MKLNNFSDLVPELVVWEDIGMMPDTWPSADEVQEWIADKADVFIEQVGYVIAEDDKRIILADSFMESNECFGNVHKIPKSVIIKRVKLYEAGNNLL